MNGIIVLSQYNLLIRGGMERTQAILETGRLQIRPVLMTCVDTRPNPDFDCSAGSHSGFSGSQAVAGRLQAQAELVE